MDTNASNTGDAIELVMCNTEEGVYEKIRRQRVSSETYVTLKTETNGENDDTSKRKVQRTKIVIIVHFVLVTIFIAAVVAVVIIKSGTFDTNSGASQLHNSTSNQSTQDLLTVIVEEKRLRHQLESKLNQLEHSQNEITKELLRERNFRQELETNFSNMRVELENMAMLINSAGIDQGMENTTLSEVQNKFVGFSVRMSSQSSVSAANPLQASNTIYNDGGDFNASAGVFVCKQPGLYFFTLTYVTYFTGIYSHCCVYKNDGRSPMPCALAEASLSSQHSTGITSGLLNLVKGDRIYVGECSLSKSIDGNSGFTGFLLQPK